MFSYSIFISTNSMNKRCAAVGKKIWRKNKKKWDFGSFWFLLCRKRAQKEMLSFYNAKQNWILAFNFVGEKFFRIKVMDANRNEIKYPDMVVESNDISNFDVNHFQCSVVLTSSMCTGSQLELHQLKNVYCYIEGS